MYDFCNYNPKFVKSGENYKTWLSPKSERSFDLFLYSNYKLEQYEAITFIKTRISRQPNPRSPDPRSFLQSNPITEFRMPESKHQFEVYKNNKKENNTQHTSYKKINISSEIVHDPFKYCSFTEPYHPEINRTHEIYPE